jgi:L-seryl-tRNA(Ser) seleniumtransferase
MSDARRALPSVNTLLESAAVRPLFERAPRAMVVSAIRSAVDAARAVPGNAPSDDEGWAARISSHLERATQRSLRPVLNGTGVVLHTNLGRAPLARSAIDAIASVAAGFTNLEYDIESGQRGSRYVHCAALLRELTGAEDALVVNNCASALVLTLNTVADRREAIVSRGELVEIGGSFRIPEIMGKSGAQLLEVGTTNRTNVDDYRRAISAQTGAIVKVHRSNFEMAGFVAEAPASELAVLATERGIPLVHDLGSGLMLSLEEYGLAGEPTAADAIRAGASIVTMSGDKLLGGPQAGLILGKRDLLDRIRKNPLTRSYRVDKLTLAALEATLGLYRDRAAALREIPSLRQITTPLEELRTRAGTIARALGERVSIVESVASVGGGAFPTARIPSIAVAINGAADAVERRLRGGVPAVIGRIMESRVLIDLRTIFPDDDRQLIAAIETALG